MRQTDLTIAERLQRVFDRHEIEFCQFCASPFIPDRRGNCGACGAHPVIPWINLTRAAITATDNAVRGFDISKWTIIKDSALALAGMTFGIIRARDGFRDDPSWQVNKALVMKLPFWGAYAFFNPRWYTEECKGGTQQAADFLALTKPAREMDGLNIPLVIDCENSPNYTMPPASKYLHELKIFVEAVQRGIGRMPIVYSNLSFFDSYLEAHADKPSSSWDAERDKSWLRACPLWLARPTTATAPGLPKAWTKWAFWQWKLDNTAHPGLSVADENLWPGSVYQLDAWCKSEYAPIPVWGATPPPPPPPVPPVPVEVTRAEFDALTARVAAVEGKAHSSHTIVAS